MIVKKLSLTPKPAKKKLCYSCGKNSHDQKDCYFHEADCHCVESMDMSLLSDPR